MSNIYKQIVQNIIGDMGPDYVLTEENKDGRLRVTLKDNDGKIITNSIEIERSFGDPEEYAYYAFLDLVIKLGVKSIFKSL